MNPEQAPRQQLESNPGMYTGNFVEKSEDHGINVKESATLKEIVDLLEQD